MYCQVVDSQKGKIMEKIEPNKTYIGVVEDNADPSKQGRLKVRVMDIFDDLEVDDIPWATPWKDLNGNGFNVPEVGKVLIVVFDQGNLDKPEFIFSDHYNINLEKKLEGLSSDNYKSMKSLIFDHKTQIYVNDDEGLKIDHKYNNINITENTIDLNLKDNNRNVNIGDATATQQTILGNHWMDWFDEFVDNLLGSKGGPFLGNLGAPVVPNPEFISNLLKYKALRDPVFLSHHVNVVDNDKITTVKNTHREDNPQVGDSWKHTKKDNNLTSKTNENFKPIDGSKQEYNTNASGITPIDLKSIVSNKKLNKLVRFMESKGYIVYNEPNKLNIIGMRTKNNGVVTNKFDDIISIFYRKDNGNWQILQYPITTTPGFKPNTKELPENVFILALGQYVDQYKLLTTKNEKGSIDYLKSLDSIVHKNDKINKYNYKSPTEKYSNMTIHQSNAKGSSEDVFNWSNGSQVFKNMNQFNQFIKLCKQQISKTKKDTFTYTLCRKSDFDKFIPNSSSG